jgi:Rps23 Pro-64 3,4-dihydroxylase Tpa1-like proline 4-hydroxylase
MSNACPDIAGAEGVDWIALYLSPWLYPVGSALSLHRDAERYTGSFTYFAHSRWSVHWGGELLVTPPTSESTVHSGDEPWMSEDGNDDADGTGIATCVSPRPNRLVVIAPDRPHRIARVDQNAGAHLRASIAGFFLRSP